MSSEIHIRRLQSAEEYGECVRLQGRIWGETFTERVPHAILQVGQRIGGVTAGAFDASGRMVGFVFGLTGVEGGRLVHWSDMLAVVPEMRDLGIGQRLKAFQRAELLDLGVELIYWTFDPLVARNAHFNLNRLGARVVEYAVDMYGADTASDLQRGLGTDRLIVAWRIPDEDPARGRSRSRGWPAGGQEAEEGAMSTELTGMAEAERSGGAPPPLLKMRAGQPEYDGAALSREARWIALPIPGDIGRVQADSLELAALWRRETREAFMQAFAAGYRIASFVRAPGGGEGWYLLGLWDDAE
jgi:predicted GNAT superfamily acetyltransferase